MNRRSFIADMLKAGVACTFLPGASRIWKPNYAPIRFIVPQPQRLDLDKLLDDMFRLVRARDARLMQDHFK